MYHFIFRTSGWKYSTNSTYIAKDGATTNMVPKMALTMLEHSIKPRNIILEPKSHTAYCFNCKAGSTTWQTLFTKMHADKKEVKSILNYLVLYIK